MNAEEVMDSVLVRLRTDSDILWYEMYVPDSEMLQDNPYGVVQVKGPYETDENEWSILGTEVQPFEVDVLVTVVAQQWDALRTEMARAVGLLRGWSAGVGVSGFTTTDSKGFDDTFSKFKPTLMVRNVIFSCRAGHDLTPAV